MTNPSFWLIIRTVITKLVTFHTLPTVGGGVIGLDGDPKVAQVAKETVEIAQVLLRETNPTQNLSLP